MNERFEQQRNKRNEESGFWLVSCIINDLYDFNGDFPTPDEVRKNWRYERWQLDITDAEINKIIADIKKLLKIS